MFRYVMAVAGVVFGALAPCATRAAADDLKGYSIDLMATLAFAFNDPQASKQIKDAGELTTHTQVYVSLAGNVFGYKDTRYPDASVDRRSTVTAPDKVVEADRGRLNVWTIEGNRLTRIVKENEGFQVYTITVDPSRTACTLAVALQPDPATGRVMRMRIYGYLAQLVSLTVRTYTCTVKPGNIFASDK